MTVLTDSLAEEAVQAVREAGGSADRSHRRPAASGPRAKRTMSPTWIWRCRSFCGSAWPPWPRTSSLWARSRTTRALDWSRPCWILDPVDGTTNLIHRFRHSAVSLALAEGGQILFGVVYNPYSGECFTARRGGGAFCNGSPIRVSGADRLADSLLSVGTVPGRRELADTAFRQMRALYDPCQDVRRTGCASLDLCWVACGRLEGYVELSLQPWDYAAGMLHRGGGRGAGHRPGRQPPFPVSGRAPAGLQRAAPQRAANTFERMRALLWTCAFPPRPGN